MEETNVPATITAIDAREVPAYESESSDADRPVVHQIVICSTNEVDTCDPVVVGDALEASQPEDRTTDSLAAPIAPASGSTDDQDGQTGTGQQEDGDTGYVTSRYEVQMRARVLVLF